MTHDDLTNLPILACAVQLTSDLIMEVIGNELSDTLDGQKIIPSSSKNLAAAILQSTVLEKL